MAILIDGYNLLNVTAVEVSGPTTIDRVRTAFLQFLLEVLPESELSTTTVVFDAKGKGTGLPRKTSYGPITVRYAVEHDEADDLIEQLIARDHAPRKLTVVSSDHRIQRAAGRRRARAVDSDVWYREIQQARRARRAIGPMVRRPEGPLSPDEVKSWEREFGDIRLADLKREIEAEAPEAPSSPMTESPKTEEKKTADPRNQNVDRGDKPTQMENPFPPGYAEDLAETLADEIEESDSLNPFPPGYADDVFDEF